MPRSELDTPEQILAAMGEVYASCRSYHDTGYVVSRWFYPDGRRTHVEHRPFTTAFVRPDHFRYEAATLGGGRYAVWTEGETAHRWWDMRTDREPPEDLSMAIAGATGVSGGSAHTVPALLLPERIGGRRLIELIDLVRRPDGVAGDVECYRIQGQYRRDPEWEEVRNQLLLERTGRPPRPSVHSPDVLWISKATFLLHQREAATQFETFRTQTVTTYDPAIDVQIPEDQLRFEPTGGRRPRLRGPDGVAS